MADIIKVKALALIRNGATILLEEVRELDGSLKGYRPLGGSVEFQETAKDTLVREFQEELGEKITVGDLYTVSESVFTYKDQDAHEILFIYHADFVNADVYQQNSIERIDTVHDIPIKAVWIDPFNTPDNVPVYPEDFFNLLKQAA